MILIRFGVSVNNLIMTGNHLIDMYLFIYLFVYLSICLYSLDRFMICCDRCGEWYHGDCVGISVAEGKRMERNGQDYLCINCNGM